MQTIALTGDVQEVRKPGLRFERFVPAVLGLVVLLCYSPVLLARFGVSDDYVLLEEGMRGSTGILQYVVACGRPVYAVLIFAGFYGLGGIEDLVFVRLAGVLGIGILAWRLSAALVMAGWNRVQAAFLALIIVAMPSFQVFAAWATAAACAWSCIAAEGAWRLASRGSLETRPRRRFGFAIMAVLLLLAGISVHQSAAMFFWVFVAIAVFRRGVTLSQAARQFAGYGVVGCCALVLGFAVLKVGSALVVLSTGAGRATMTLDFAQKIQWFLSEPMVNALGFAELFPRRRYCLAAAFLIVGGLLRSFGGPISHRLQLGALAAALVPLSYAPNLAAAESAATYRTLAALTGLWIVYAFLALHGWLRTERSSRADRIVTVALGLGAAWCLALAAWHVHFYYARPQTLELARLRQQLRQSDLAHASGVFLILPRAPDYYSKRYDEFGVPSTFLEWVPKPMVSLVLDEISPALSRLPVEHFPAETPVSPPPGTVLVDMR